MKSQTIETGALRRIAFAVVRAELQRLRPSTATPVAIADWPDDLAIGEDGLGLDSLEQLGALGALAETFGLHDDTLLPSEPPLFVGDWVGWLDRSRTSGIHSISVTTSGSTGVPKTCRHAVGDLLQEAADLATLFSDRQRVIALVPAHHLYGLIWTALLPAALDKPVIDRTVAAPLGLKTGDLVVAVPDQWQAMLRLRPDVPNDCIAVSSAGSLTDRQANDLLNVGFARVVDVYGSTETGGIGLRDAPAVGYDLLPRWTLQADGSDWQIVDRSGRVVAIPDHVEMLECGRLKRLGRRDGAVKIAGHTVWPQHVEQTLRELGCVTDVAVRVGLNGRLKAFVVPGEGIEAEPLRVALETFANERLTAPERPKAYLFGNSLPRNDLGKLVDWR